MSGVAISLSGGGSKGAWSGGALQALVELEDVCAKTSIVVGTSTGALQAALVGLAIATGDITHVYDLLDIYRSVQDGNVLQPRSKFFHSVGGTKGALAGAILGNQSSVFDITPLVNLADRYMTPQRWTILLDAAADGKVEVGFCIQNMRTGLTEMRTTTADDVEDLRLAMIASAAQPVLMNPVLIDGTQYCDGGVRMFQPVPHIFDMQFREPEMKVYAISTGKKTPPHGPAQYPDVISQLERTLAIMTDSVYWTNITATKARQARERADTGKTLDVVWLEPTRRIVSDALRFRQPQMSQLVDRGFADAVGQLDKLKRDEVSEL